MDAVDPGGAQRTRLAGQAIRNAEEERDFPGIERPRIPLRDPFAG